VQELRDDAASIFITPSLSDERIAAAAAAAVAAAANGQVM